MKNFIKVREIGITFVIVLLSFMACLIPSNRRGEEFNGVFLLVMQSMVMLGPAMGFAQAGFIESLRRIDLLKPIPFKSSTIVFFEVLCKAVGSWFSVVVGLLTALVLKPELWQYVVGGLIMFPALTLALSSVSLLLVLLLPDIEDPTQRGFRGLATMLGMIASAPARCPFRDSDLDQSSCGHSLAVRGKRYDRNCVVGDVARRSDI